MCVFESHTFVPISQTCKKQTAVSHRSTVSEIISLDAGLRVDCLPALQFLECVLQKSSSKPAKENIGRHNRERVTASHSHSDNSVFESIDKVPPNIPNSSHSTQLYIPLHSQ